MKLSVRTVICVLASLVVLICFSSVYGHRVTADSTIVESGSLWNCDWELDADGNLYVICKANTLGLGYLISNVQNEVKTVTFDLSGVDSSYGITINGSGADISSISFADTEFIVDSVYLENFTTVDKDHIFFLTGQPFELIGLQNMTVTDLSFLKDTEVSEVRIEDCSDLNANELGLSGSVRSVSAAPRIARRGRRLPVPQGSIRSRSSTPSSDNSDGESTQRSMSSMETHSAAWSR